MGTVAHAFTPFDAVPATSNFPTLDVVAGSNFPVPALDFDAATEETCFLNYGSGDLTLKIQWYADTANSGNVIWGAALAAITPNSDTQDIETKAFATAQTVTDSHLGTTGQRLHECEITISNLDGLAAGDWCALKFYRDADAGGDTMSGDASLVALILTYSDS
jgi:hypothetical protein